MGEIDMLEARRLLPLHIAVQSTSANNVEQLRSAAYSKNRQFFPERVTDQSDLYFIFKRMGFFEMLEIFRTRLVMLGLDIFALDKQKSLHICHVFRQARGRAFNDRHHDRQDPGSYQKRKMIFTNVINVFVFANRSAGNDENKGAVHRSNISSASTNLESFSRPCDATRM